MKGNVSDEDNGLDGFQPMRSCRRSLNADLPAGTGMEPLPIAGDHIQVVMLRDLMERI